MRVGDIVNEHGRPVDDPNGQIVEFVNLGRGTVERDHVFKVANLLSANGRHDVLPTDRVDDILRR